MTERTAPMDSGGGHRPGTWTWNTGSDRRRRTKNMLIFMGTIGLTLIVLAVSFLMTSENRYNKHIKVSRVLLLRLLNKRLRII